MSLEIRNSRIKLSLGRVFWREVGQGPTLVFLHGSWTDSSQWVPLIERLGYDYHCYALDLLGFGESEFPNHPYSVALQVQCLREYLEALKLNQVYLVGHSLGAWVAVSYALKEVEQVQGLALLAPEGVAIAQWQKRWWWESWLVTQPPLLAWSLRTLLPFASLLGKKEAIARHLQWRKQLLAHPAACQTLFQRRKAAIQAEFVQEQLSWLTVPTLLLQTEPDPGPRGLLGRAYLQALPKAQLRMIPPGGEDWPQDFPDAIAQYLREWITPLD